jgi:hypothetical protein
MINCLKSFDGFCHACKEGFRQKDGACIKESTLTLQKW